MKHDGYHDGCTLPPECGYHALSLLNIGRRDASVCYIHKQLVVTWGYQNHEEKAKTLTFNSSYWKWI